MSECHKMSDAELEQLVDEMLDQMASEITPAMLFSDSNFVRKRVKQILKERGMWVSNDAEKGGARKRTRRNRSKKSRSTRRRR